MAKGDLPTLFRPWTIEKLKSFPFFIILIGLNSDGQLIVKQTAVKKSGKWIGGCSFEIFLHVNIMCKNKKYQRKDMA